MTRLRRLRRHLADAVMLADVAVYVVAHHALVTARFVRAERRRAAAARGARR